MEAYRSISRTSHICQLLGLQGPIEQAHRKRFGPAHTVWTDEPPAPTAVCLPQREISRRASCDRVAQSDAAFVANNLLRYDLDVQGVAPSDVDSRDWHVR